MMSSYNARPELPLVEQEAVGQATRWFGSAPTLPDQPWGVRRCWARAGPALLAGGGSPFAARRIAGALGDLASIVGVLD